MDEMERVMSKKKKKSEAKAKSATKKKSGKGAAAKANAALAMAPAGAFFAADAHSAGHASKPPVVSAPSPNHASRQGNAIQYLILHNTDGPGKGSLATLRDPSIQRSAHYMVDRDGTIYQLVDDSQTAWHAGNKPINQQSIGVEIVAWKNALKMTPVQQDAVVALARFVVDAYDIRLANVKPHRAVRIGGTDCPGWIWPTDADLEQWKAQFLS
jgi:N-acetylmuramoyl-L-alanine amidase